MKKVGTVTHYYDKIGVAILELSGSLNVGDRIKFGDSDDSLEQTVESMEVDHKAVQKAKSGDIVGLKADKKVKEGTEVYLAE